MKRNSIIIILLCLFSILCWICIYFLTMILKKGYGIQFLIQSSILVFSGSLMLLSLLYEKLINNISSRINSKIKRIISLISESTLEIYLIQVTFNEIAVEYRFPINAILFWCIAFGGGIIYHKLLSRIPI